LEEAVRGRFLLDYPRKGGVNLRDTLNAVEHSAGIHDPQLDVSDIPEGFESWYVHFMQLHTTDGIRYADIDAYQKVTGLSMTPVEIKALFVMDRAAMSAIASIMKEG
jgi:hypothetical protein